MILMDISISKQEQNSVVPAGCRCNILHIKQTAKTDVYIKAVYICVCVCVCVFIQLFYSYF